MPRTCVAGSVGHPGSPIVPETRDARPRAFSAELLPAGELGTEKMRGHYVAQRGPRPRVDRCRPTSRAVSAGPTPRSLRGTVTSRERDSGRHSRRLRMRQLRAARRVYVGDDMSLERQRHKRTNKRTLVGRLAPRIRRHLGVVAALLKMQ